MRWPSPLVSIFAAMVPGTPEHHRTLLIRAGLVLAGCIGLLVVIDQLLLPSLVHASKTVRVPTLVGKTVDQALRLMVEHDLALVQPKEQFSDKVPKGHIMTQLPYANALVKEGRRIYVTVSKGVELASVPNVRGMTLRDARLAMMRAGLTIGGVTYEQHDSVEANRVLTQSSPPGSELGYGSVCHVVLSRGPATIPIPDVRSLTLQQATEALHTSGFTIAPIVYRSSSAFVSNTVIDQMPGPDSTVVPGTTITLTVVR